MNEQGMSQNGWIESPEHNADGNSLSALDVKITDLFPGVTVRKDLVNKVKGNALVPSYVLEFLLSAYATNTNNWIKNIPNGTLAIASAGDCR